jgi:hypothetical protein
MSSADNPANCKATSPQVQGKSLLTRVSMRSIEGIHEVKSFTLLIFCSITEDLSFGHFIPLQKFIVQ